MRVRPNKASAATPAPAREDSDLDSTEPSGPGTSEQLAQASQLIVQRAYASGGFWSAVNVIVAGYIGLIASPSILANFVKSTSMMAVAGFFCLIAGWAIGAQLAWGVGALLARSNIGRFWLFLPLAGLATWLTLRIPSALAAWWDSAPFF